MTSFYIATINVRGLNDPKKRRSIYTITWFRNGNYDLAFLQETYSKADIKQENIWKNEFGGRVIFAHGTNHSAGIMILLKNGFDINILDTYSGNDGRSLMLKTKIHDIQYYLINVYAPNYS